MKAIQATQFGPPSVLSLVELPDPTPGPGQLSIDVSHAAVGLIDVFFRQGIFKDVPGLPKPPFVPGLEVAGTVRALGKGVQGFSLGEKVVTFSATGTDGYASILVTNPAFVVSLKGHNIEPSLAVAAVPNAAMAVLALTRIAHLVAGESVLVHGALGGFASAFPGVAHQLGAKRVAGTVRSSKFAAASTTKLPYDQIVDSSKLSEELGDERFDVIVDPVGGELRSRSLDLLRPGGRLIVVGNASGDFTHTIDSNRLWLRNVTIAGFNAGAYVPTHPNELEPAVEAALKAVAAGLILPELEVLPLADAAKAHERMESRELRGRIVLAPAERP